MNTLSNIIPNPLNIDKTLNSDYSNNQFATSDFNGKSNTEILKNYKDNITPMKMPNGFYLGGIGEVGIIMENISYLNNIIKKYGGTEISIDGKYVSSTLYNEKNISNSKYTLENTNKVWYFDNSYGKISYDLIDTPYQSIPLYKYDRNDFEFKEEYIESSKTLYIGHKAQISDDSEIFDVMTYIYYCQNDFLDNLENTSSYSFFEKKTQIQYNLINTVKSTYIIVDEHNHLNFTDNTWNSPASNLFVKIKSNSKYVPCEPIVNMNNNYYLYFYYNGNNYCIDSNDNNVKFKNRDNVQIDSSHYKDFSSLPVDLVECTLAGNSVSEVYLYVQDYKNNESILELKDDNIIKYPIYYSDNTYSFPLLPTYRENDYYDCEFYIFIPEFSQYNDNTNQLDKTFSIDLIFKKIKVLIKFGNNEIVETLDPYIKLNDTIIYKFKKRLKYNYKYIHNQEIKIYLINSGEDEDNQVIYSKKVYFNLFELKIYQNIYNNPIDFRFKYNNYYPLKYPLPSKKKFIDIDYVPTELIENSSYDELMEINSKLNSETDFFKDSNEEYQIKFSYLVNNYSYLNHYIYHNYSEGYDIIDWFTKENSYGLMISPSKNNTKYTYFNFSIENYKANSETDSNKANVEIYCKTFTNYDEDGILNSTNTDIIKIQGEDLPINDINPDLTYSHYGMNIYGMKQLLYIPYKFNINNIYGIQTGQNKMFFVNDTSIINNYSIFEDYLYIYNSRDDDIQLYFNDESKILCQGNKIINIKSKECKLYKPSRHDNYIITLKTSIINKYKLIHYKIYKNYYNDPKNRITNITNILYRLNLLKLSNINIDSSDVDNFINRYQISIDNEGQIINIQIYNYSIPLFGNIIVIR